MLQRFLLFQYIQYCSRQPADDVLQILEQAFSLDGAPPLNDVEQIHVVPTDPLDQFAVGLPKQILLLSDTGSINCLRTA